MHSFHDSFPPFGHASVHCDSGPRAWGPGERARCVVEQQQQVVRVVLNSSSRGTRYRREDMRSRPRSVRGGACGADDGGRANGPREGGHTAARGGDGTAVRAATAAAAANSGPIGTIGLRPTPRPNSSKVWLPVQAHETWRV